MTRFHRVYGIDNAGRSYVPLTVAELAKIGDLFPELRLKARLLIGHQRDHQSYYRKVSELLQLIYLCQDLETFR